MTLFTYKIKVHLDHSFLSQFKFMKSSVKFLLLLLFDLSSLKLNKPNYFKIYVAYNARNSSDAHFASWPSNSDH